jgi:CoA transferase family III
MHVSDLPTFDAVTGTFRPVPAACSPDRHLSLTDDASAWAASGGQALTGAADGPPLPVAAPIATAVAAALQTLRAHAGVNADLPDCRLIGERAACARLSRRGPVTVGGSGRLIRTADGWALVNLPRAVDRAALPALLDLDAEAVSWSQLEQWAASKASAFISERAMLLELAIGTSAAEAGDAALAARGQHDTTTPVLSVRAGEKRRGHRPHPLVVDLSALWAGPLAAHLLGLTGARVVKVESPRRPDGARLGPRQFFDLLHGAHESVSVDFTNPDDVGRLRRLLEAADIVIESSRPRALEALDISPYDVCADTSGLTWVSITGYGRTGPWANRIGFGDDCSVAGGLIARDGDRAFPVADAVADPLAGVHAAAAALAAHSAGGGVVLDVALRDVARSVAQRTVGQSRIDDIDVRPPFARTPTLRAPDLGADNHAHP